MTIKLLFGIVASILAIFCFIPYIRDIFGKKTTPHMYSWFLWGVLQIVGAVAIIFKNGGYGAMELLVGSFFCFFIFFLSFRYGTKNINKFDGLCLFLVLFTILIWIFTEDALYSVILVAFIDLVAFLPTYRKGYEEPFTETISNYYLSALASTFAILALSSYSLTTVLYLATLVSTNIFFSLLLFYRRKTIKLLMKITEPYKGKSGIEYILEYSDVDSFDHLEYARCRQVYGVCFYEDKMIIGYGGKKNDWGLVGGTIEKEETFEQTLKREIQEESNMEVLKFLPIGYQKVIDTRDSSYFFQLRYVCTARPFGPFVRDPDESITEIKLIDPRDYKQYFDWGKIGERIIERSLKLKDELL